MIDPIEHFEARVSRAGGDACWLWTGSVHEDGYGRFNLRTTQGVQHFRAHRFALQQALGRSLLPDMQALHTCDTTLCVRNDEVGSYEVNGVAYPRRGHLFEADHKVNTADMIAKERSARGAAIWQTKLTAENVLDIRSRFAAGTQQVTLAREYNVDKSNIGAIVHRRTWTHI